MYSYLPFMVDMLWASLLAQLVKNPCRRPWFNSCVGKIRWRKDRLLTPVFLGFPCGSAGKESATARQASLSITNSQSLPKLMSIELVMPSNHLILCHPLLLLPSIFSSIRVFSNESTLHIRWPKYWSFSFSIRPSNEYAGLISFSID